MRLMSEKQVPKLVVDDKVEIAVSLAGVGAVCAATYYVAQTGSWEPLSATSLGLALTVLFITSEE